MKVWQSIALPVALAAVFVLAFFAGGMGFKPKPYDECKLAPVAAEVPEWIQDTICARLNKYGAVRTTTSKIVHGGVTGMIVAYFEAVPEGEFFTDETFIGTMALAWIDDDHWLLIYWFGADGKEYTRPTEDLPVRNLNGLNI